MIHGSSKNDSGSISKGACRRILCVVERRRRTSSASSFCGSSRAVRQPSKQTREFALLLHQSRRGQTHSAEPRPIGSLTPFRRPARLGTTRPTPHARIVIHNVQPRRLVTLFAPVSSILILSPPTRGQLCSFASHARHVGIFIHSLSTLVPVTRLTYPLTAYLRPLRPVPIIARAPGRRLRALRATRPSIQPQRRIPRVPRALLCGITRLTYPHPFRRLDVRSMPVPSRAFRAAPLVLARALVRVRLALGVVFLLVTRGADRAVSRVDLTRRLRPFPRRARRRARRRRVAPAASRVR